jgi:hypothetical protein
MLAEEGKQPYSDTWIVFLVLAAAMAACTSVGTISPRYL